MMGLSKTKKLDSAIKGAAETMWRYLHLGSAPTSPVDCLLIFGGHDPRIGLWAASLYRKRMARFVLVSGGSAHLPIFDRQSHESTEAAVLGRVLQENGVPVEALLLEDRARNTSENYWFAAELLRSHDLRSLQKFGLIAKPYAERRVLATGLKRWPEKDLRVFSEDLTLEDYLELRPIDPVHIVKMMIGEVNRMEEYVHLGYLEPDDPPDEVRAAVMELAELGIFGRGIGE